MIPIRVIIVARLPIRMEQPSDLRNVPNTRAPIPNPITLVNRNIAASSMITIVRSAGLNGMVVPLDGCSR